MLNSCNNCEISHLNTSFPPPPSLLARQHSVPILESSTSISHTNISSSSSSCSRLNIKYQFVKTKLCPSGLSCAKINSTCTFAHTKEELRLAPDLRRTKLCEYTKKNLPCPFDPKRISRENQIPETYDNSNNNDGCSIVTNYNFTSSTHGMKDNSVSGENSMNGLGGRDDYVVCAYAHSVEELRLSTHLQCFKMRMCRFWAKGLCYNQDKCRFAHGCGEVRAHAHPLVPPTPTKSSKHLPVDVPPPPSAPYRPPALRKSLTSPSPSPSPFSASYFREGLYRGATRSTNIGSGGNNSGGNDNSDTKSSSSKSCSRGTSSKVASPVLVADTSLSLLSPKNEYLNSSYSSSSEGEATRANTESSTIQSCRDTENSSSSISSGSVAPDWAENRSRVDNSNIGNCIGCNSGNSRNCSSVDSNSKVQDVLNMVIAGLSEFDDTNKSSRYVNNNNYYSNYNNDISDDSSVYINHNNPAHVGNFMNGYANLGGFDCITATTTNTTTDTAVETTPINSCKGSRTYSECSDINSCNEGTSSSSNMQTNFGNNCNLLTTTTAASECGSDEFGGSSINGMVYGFDNGSSNDPPRGAFRSKSSRSNENGYNHNNSKYCDSDISELATLLSLAFNFSNNSNHSSSFAAPSINTDNIGYSSGCSSRGTSSDNDDNSNFVSLENGSSCSSVKSSSSISNFDNSATHCSSLNILHSNNSGHFNVAASKKLSQLGNVSSYFTW